VRQGPAVSGRPASTRSSHGIGLTPDKQELGVCDAHNSHVHAFDADHHATSPACPKRFGGLG